MPRGDLIQIRKGTAALWSSVNPVLAEGELGLETDTGKIKGGNGVNDWNSLPYSGSGGGGGGSSWGSITGTLSDQTDLQTALNAKANTSDVVLKGDYSPSHSILVQQSGTGSPTALQVGNNTLIGRLSGGGSQINDLSASDVRTLLSINNVDNTSDLDKPVSTATQTALNAKLDDTQFDGLAKITVGTTAPSSPSTGDLWIDTN
jgi:hypothetical protein